MTDSNQTPEEIIAQLFQIAMTQQSYELDVFVSVAGHVKSVQVQVIKNCSYAEGEPFNSLLNITILQKSNIFKQELRTALSNVLAIVSENNMKGAA